MTRKMRILRSAFSLAILSQTGIRWRCLLINYSQKKLHVATPQKPNLQRLNRMYSHSVMAATPQDILDFWFVDPKRWYMKDDNFDKEIKTKFEATMKKAAGGELGAWLDTPDGALALIILLDQFTRNVYRNSAESFAYDAKALEFAKEAIKRGHDQFFKSKGDTKKQGFLYMPFMHSESKADHEEALKLFDQPGLEGNLAYEKKHKEIIDRFGRYCHRNEILGRKSSPEEIEFLKTHGGF